MIWIISIYLVSALGMWFYTRILYSKNGNFPCSRPDIVDVIFVLIPGLNTVACIVNWIFSFPYRDMGFSKDFAKRFFKL